MSAAEVIEQIKTLSPDERKQVAEFVQTLNATESASEGPRRIDRARFEKAMDAVFTKHHEVLRRLAQ